MFPHVWLPRHMKISFRKGYIQLLHHVISMHLEPPYHNFPRCEPSKLLSWHPHSPELHHSQRTFLEQQSLLGFALLNSQNSIMEALLSFQAIPSVSSRSNLSFLTSTPGISIDPRRGNSLSFPSTSSFSTSFPIRAQQVLKIKLVAFVIIQFILLNSDLTLSESVDPENILC